jgi:hypothetical protein
MLLIPNKKQRHPAYFPTENNTPQTSIILPQTSIILVVYNRDAVDFST